MHNKLGLGEVTQPKNGCPQLLSIIYYANLCNFLIFSFYFDPVCGILHDLIWACICNALVLNVNVPFKVTLNVSAKQQRLVIIL